VKREKHISNRTKRLLHSVYFKRWYYT